MVVVSFMLLGSFDELLLLRKVLLQRRRIVSKAQTKREGFSRKERRAFGP